MIRPSEIEAVRAFMQRGREAGTGLIKLGDTSSCTALPRDAVGYDEEGRELRLVPRDLDRSLSPEVREAARCALHRDMPFVHEVFPSWEARRLTFETPEHFVAHSPCVVWHKGRLLASVRCMNYAPGAEGEYYRISDGAQMSGTVVPVSRTLMLEIDPATLKERVLGELKMPLDLRPSALGDCARSYGFEDTRLFGWGGDLWGIAAFYERSADGLAEQWVFRIDLDTLLISDARHVPLQERGRRGEKNWVPILGGGPEPRFLYMSDPSTVVDAWGCVVSERVPVIAAEHFHGGSQLVPFDGGWLAIVRWMQIFDPANRWVQYEYRNRFAWYDSDFFLRRVSPPWQFPIEPNIPSFPRRMQIVQGLAWHPDQKTLIVGYEVCDNGNPFVAKVAATEVGEALGPYSGDYTETYFSCPYIAHNLRLGHVVFDFWITNSTAKAWYHHSVYGEVGKLWCVAHLKPGMTAIDCGAHHGQMTVGFAKAVGPSGRVISFDALSENVGVIKRNLELNDIHNAEVHAYALGAENGEAYFEDGGSNAKRAAEGVPTRVVSLDMMVGREHVDLIKIDVEGDELDVLRGARGIIERDRPSINIEIHNLLVADRVKNLDDMLLLLASCDYSYSSPDYTGDPAQLKDYILAQDGAELLCEFAKGNPSKEDDPVSRHETKAGVLWLPDRESDLIARDLKNGYLFEQEIVDEGCRHIRPGTDVLDLGANFGAMTIPFARAAQGGVVHAVEAEPFVARTLRRNLVENNANVMVYERAAWHTSGVELTVLRPDFDRLAGYWGWGNCEVEPRMNGEKLVCGPRWTAGAIASGTALSLAIDDLEIKRSISFMKVDVQGSDLFAMRGARKTILRNRMPILFEFEKDACERFGTSWEDYELFISEIGYSITKVIYEHNYLIEARS